MAEFDPSANSGTMPVQERHQFDVERLQTFMEGNVEGYSGKLSVEEFAGGQSNPTYLLTAGENQYVMRRDDYVPAAPDANGFISYDVFRID